MNPSHPADPSPPGESCGPRQAHLEDLLPDIASGPTRLPRRQEGSSPQDATVTLLADYSLRTRAWFPSAAVVDLLGAFGVSTASARASISRLSRRGVLDSQRDGRQTRYRLTGPAAAGLAFGGREIATFAEAAETWDGWWSLIAFSLPQGEGTQRRALRGRLRWLGFMPLYDALWVSPDPLPPYEAYQVVGATQGVRATPGAVTAFRAQRLTVDSVAGRDPIEAWDLPGIARHYEDFVDRWSAVPAAVQAGTVSGPEAIRMRTQVMDVYRRFVVLDPRLPMRSMPPGWLRQRAHEVFVEVYDGLAPTARRHVLDVVARYSDGPCPDIQAHSVAELGRGIVPPGVL